MTDVLLPQTEREEPFQTLPAAFEQGQSTVATTDQSFRLSHPPSALLSLPAALPASPIRTAPIHPTPSTQSDTTSLCDPTDTSQHMCQKGCSKSFSSSKDLLRHYKKRAHLPADIKTYQCRCGYTNVRKDHYQRHLNRKAPCRARHEYYRCICSENVLDDNIQKHRDHLAVCTEGQGRAGRPRGQGA